MILLANSGVGYKFNPIKIFISDKRDENFKLHWQVVQSHWGARFSNRTHRDLPLLLHIQFESCRW